MKELLPGGEEEEEEEEDEQEEGGGKPYEMDRECKDAASEVDMEMEHVEASDAGKHTEETCSQSPKGQCATKTNTHSIKLMMD